ncbi:MAG TPA: MBL fold metallo-hydrolase [Beijerinckiaceae bacterium]|nr:MBL fold metallo-hydrolase [Beijerinckiaceae bacterium]
MKIAASVRVTFVGTGDAFNSGGRAHTCFRLDSNGSTLVVDFGASALSAWRKLGLELCDIDAIALSHLHGDHFGALPFILLDYQFVSRCKEGLVIAGPPGTEARLHTAMEALFPKSTENKWRFKWSVREMALRESTLLAGYEIVTTEMLHPSGAPSTALRISKDGKLFAYSGDTAWNDGLFDVAEGADLFVVECSSGESPLPYHLDWPTIKSNLPRLKAKRVAVTHMGESALARSAEIRAAGVHVAYDGEVVDI